jgi:hypothetical protein
MASDKPNAGPARGGTERIESSFPDEEEERTNPDPAVLAAMEALRKAQEATNTRVSDITELLIRKKRSSSSSNTPVPQR